MGLNRIINQRISLGAFQIKAFLILALVDMNDGVELVLSSFLNPIIKAVYPDVTSSFIQTLISVFYIGILIGSLTSGHLADKYGRRKLIRYGAVMQMVVALLFYLANSLTLMLILRFLYGFSFGFSIAVTTSMFAEITPEQYRGKGILLINFCISIGKIYAVMLGFIFIEQDISQTNWKLMLVTGSFPNIIVLFGSQFILTQSPRFHLAHKEYEEGISVLNHMIMVNKGSSEPSLSAHEQEELRYQFSTEEQGNNHLNLSVLFNSENINKTIAISVCWIVINFTFYGQLTIEALHISGPQVSLREGLSKYFFTVFGQFPSLCITLYLIDHPSFGRKHSLILYFTGAAIFHLSFAFTALTLMGSIARFFMKDVFQVIYPLTTESFQTKIRAKGFGLCSGIGRLGAILMPFIVFPLDEWKHSSVYVVFSLLSIYATWMVWSRITETMNINLDNTKQGELLSEVDK